MIVTVTKSFQVDLEELTDEMDLDSKLRLLQYLWDDLKKELTPKDWEEFYEENFIQPIIQRKTSTCPKCGSDQIEGVHSPSVYELHGQQVAGQECTCTVCEAQWIDTYSLTGIEWVDLGKE